MASRLKGGASGGGGAEACEQVLSGLRQKHEMKTVQKLPARSTVGIVLEGTVVNIIVPGSPAFNVMVPGKPSYNPEHAGAGRKIEAGDTITAIDGTSVDKENVISRLRGGDEPGSSVTVTVLKKGSDAELDFRLVRADMRTVMNLKDMYMAFAELHKDITTDRLRQKADILEKCIQTMTSFFEQQEEHAQGHIGDLESSVRDLWAQKDQGNASQEGFQALKQQHDTLLAECTALKQQLEAAEAKAASSSVVNLFKSAAGKAKQQDAEARASAAEQEARANHDLQSAVEDAEKLRREAERKQAQSAKDLVQARAEVERLQKEIAQLQDSAAGQERAMQMEKEAGSRLRVKAGEESKRADVAEKQLQRLKEEHEVAKDKLLQAQKALESIQQNAGSKEDALHKELQRSKEEIGRLSALCDNLRQELGAASENETTAKAQLDAALRQVEDGRKAVVDIHKLQLEPLQETERKLLSQLAVHKAELQDLQNEIENQKKATAVAENRADMQQEKADNKIQEAAEAQAAAKGLQRQVEQAKVQIARLEKDLQSEHGVVEKEHDAMEKALKECSLLREEVHKQQAIISDLEISSAQEKSRASVMEQNCKTAQNQLLLGRKEVEMTQQEMRVVSEESKRTRIQLEETTRALVSKDAQIAQQVQVLKRENDDSQKIIFSLNKERLELRQKVHEKLEHNAVIRRVPPPIRESVAMQSCNEQDTGKIHRDRRMVMLENALLKSEKERAALQRQLRDAGLESRPTEGDVEEHSSRSTPLAQLDGGSLPFFNTRTNDIAATATVALSSFFLVGIMSYLQATIGGGFNGGIAGALVVASSLVGFVFFVLCLFKVFLYLFGANSDHVMRQSDYLPIGAEPTNAEAQGSRTVNSASLPDAGAWSALEVLGSGRSTASGRETQRAGYQYEQTPRAKGIAGWKSLDSARAASGRSQGRMHPDLV